MIKVIEVTRHEGFKGGKYFLTRIAQVIFEKANEKATITGDIFVPSLCHNYATHLLEGGTDLKYTQEIVDDKSSKTIEIYTYLRMKSLSKIRNPIDNINLIKVVSDKNVRQSDILAFQPEAE